MLTHPSQTIREGRLHFAIPCHLLDGNISLSTQLPGQQVTIENKPTRRAWCERWPDTTLALGFQPEMRPALFKGDLHRPAHHHPRQDLLCGCVESRTEEGLYPEFPLRIADHHITDLDRRQSRSVPQRGVREDQQAFALAPVPAHFLLSQGVSERFTQPCQLR